MDGLLMDTRMAALLHAAGRLPQGTISGHTLVRFDIHLTGALQRVIKFVRPKPLRAGPVGLSAPIRPPRTAGPYACLAA